MASILDVPDRTMYAHPGQTLWSEHDGDPANHAVFYCHDEHARLRWRVRPHQWGPGWGKGNGWELAPRPRPDAVRYPPPGSPWWPHRGAL